MNVRKGMTLAALVATALAAAPDETPAAAAEEAVGPLEHLLSPGPGWTAFKPAADTRIIYVSSSTGSATNDGLSPERPLKAIAKGFALLRNKHSDWLLLKRGDVWDEPLGKITVGDLKNGLTEEQPTLFASYGTEGPRPLLKGGKGLEVLVNRPGKARNIAVVGIHFYDEKGDPRSEVFLEGRDKSGTGVCWVAPSENLLIEDCRFEYLTGVSIQGKAPWHGALGNVMRNVKVRRCVTTHGWSSGGHCQGFFFHKVDGLLLEENLLDHNGYCIETGDLPTWFNHNVYITIHCDKVVARGKIVTRSSTAGIYCRTNGVLEGNLCVDNSPSINLGRINPPRPGGVTGRVSGNVVIGALERKNKKRSIGGGPGIEVGNVNDQGVAVESNIIIGLGPETSPALKISPAGVGAHHVVMRKNTVYNWTRCLGWVGTEGKELKKLKLSANRVAHNLLQIHRQDNRGLVTVRCRDTADGAGVALAHNIYYFPPTQNACAQVAIRGRVPLAKWLRLAREEGSRVQKVQFVDPDRDVAAYHRSLGREGTLEAFLEEASKQSKFNWREEYTAKTVIAYIREGFRPRTDLGREQIGAVPSRREAADRVEPREQ